MVSTQAAILIVSKMVGLADFRSHLKSGPFPNQPLLTIRNTDTPRFQIPTEHTNDTVLHDVIYLCTLSV